MRAARELLEEDGSAGLSLRAVARRAGVSTTAPYRHYAGREALVSAVAAEGYRELVTHLAQAHPAPSTPGELAAVAVACVRFALEHPALFRAMSAEPCDPTSDERVAATAAISEYVRTVVGATFPGVDADALSTTVWALVHGLAFLHLDGKLDSPPRRSSPPGSPPPSTRCSTPPRRCPVRQRPLSRRSERGLRRRRREPPP
ncbi:transcriptional regulator, TetR family [Streptomyces sp. Cmuel-A718b]|nr:transcriptional regulator, TetR family [Streptomyces sp. Cmuel-A718b]